MKIRKSILLCLFLVAWGFSCNETVDTKSKGKNSQPGDLPPEGIAKEYYDINGKRVQKPMLGPDHEVSVREENKAAFAASNPYGLAVAVNSPYNGNAETTAAWAPPSHTSYWGGDWAGDFWKDNGNNSADFGNFTSCWQDIFLNVEPVILPGGNRAQQLKAKLIYQGPACKSGDYKDGGLTQKWEIIAVYSGVQTTLGFVVYTHLADNLVYNNAINTVVNLNGPLKIGTSFSTGAYNSCWGSCHIHMELFTSGTYSCYNVNPPLVNIKVVGIIGGSQTSLQHCPTIQTKTNWARSAVNCGRSSVHSAPYECSRVYDGVVSAASKWVSNGGGRTSWMTLDLGTHRNISEFVLKHAGSVGEPSASNTRAYQIQYSTVGMNGPWTTIVNGINGSQLSQTSHSVSLYARYVAILVTDPGVDNYTRIVEFEVNGQ